LGSFCNGGTFSINSLTDSTLTNCVNMHLAMDSTGLIFTANFPYPNLKCTVTLKCNSDASISQNFVAVSYERAESWPYMTSNNIIVSPLAISD
jgi:hypothetical protein